MDNKSKYQLGLYEKAMPKNLSWHEKLRIAKEAGFDYLEMSIDETDEKLERLEWDQTLRAALKQTMQDTGIMINSICLSAHRKYPLGSHEEQIRQRSLEIMEKTIDLACDLGIRLIQLAGYDVYYEDGDELTKKYFMENLSKAVMMAAKKGINLGFETMETPFMDTVEKAMQYVTKIDNAYLGVYPDIGNLTNASILYGHDVNEDLAKGKGHLFAAHLKETIPGRYREIPFGSGHTKYIANIDKLKALGVRMFVGEFWDIGNASWKQDLKDANDFLRARLDQVFVKDGD